MGMDRGGAWKSKGDALERYALPDSVALAIELLDHSMSRPAVPEPSNAAVHLRAEHTQFEMLHGASFDAKRSTGGSARQSGGGEGGEE
jgi:hypothetical protein